MIVCLCGKLTEKDFQKILEQGTCSLRELQEKRLAAFDCGSCLRAIENRLNERQKDDQVVPICVAR